MGKKTNKQWRIHIVAIYISLLFLSDSVCVIHNQSNIEFFSFLFSRLLV